MTNTHQEKKNQLFPKPPSHYKNNSLKIPNLNTIGSKLDCISIYGEIMKLKKINFPVIAAEDNYKLKETHNLLLMLKEEINTSRKIYLTILGNAFNCKNINKFIKELHNSLDCIYNLIYKLKKKQILIKSKYFIENEVLCDSTKLSCDINEDLSTTKRLLAKTHLQL